MNTSKRLVGRIVATIAIIFGATPLWAYDFGVDGIYYNITSWADQTVEVTFQGEA